MIAWDCTSYRQWLLNRGRDQSVAFAKAFLQVFQPPKAVFTLLDVGCGEGDGTRWIQNYYPQAYIKGCDPYGKRADYSWNLSQIQDDWGIILCSNILEHTQYPLYWAGKLLKHCQVLYILVPYREPILDRVPPRLNPNELAEGHIRSFTEATFDRLPKAQVKCQLLDIPGASLWTWGQFVKNGLANVIRLLKSRPLITLQRYILYEIRREEK